MCLVEIEKSPKPVAACAMPTTPNMKIYTDTPLENIISFFSNNFKAVSWDYIIRQLLISLKSTNPKKNLFCFRK